MEMEIEVVELELRLNSDSQFSVQQFNLDVITSWGKIRARNYAGITRKVRFAPIRRDFRHGNRLRIE